MLWWCFESIHPRQPRTTCFPNCGQLGLKKGNALVRHNFWYSPITLISLGNPRAFVQIYSASFYEFTVKI
ncbi:hypothetical protein M408DRAFT_165473 [Serendipita vermifera MAFF 305830]|uniref:Uncharacterized protein n=1 Tax=Serendipita vermifera MAFF 305830 TaxID=933852 RepID=A0A0C2XEE6_SERVB|nr:hypothetical protein M408DRAFT_165473 [Serendipita vermifera MAFF 305830]